jgi:uncharacterized protein (DUF1501 family)
MKRRAFVRIGATLPLLGGVGAASLLGSLSLPGSAAASDYRALVCVYLNGGNDGNNTLIPRDGAHGDYASARPDLALPKDSLAKLDGASIGHSFGLHPALAPLATLYNQQRLAWVANVGPLIVPATGEQVRDRAVAVPPFLLSHSDQADMQQGWMGDADASGWAGRSLELLPASLKQPLSAVTMDNNRTLVLGRHSSVAFMQGGGGARWWGRADLAQPESYWSQSINRMAQWQFANDYEAEYARSFNSSVTESTILTKAFLQAREPQADFGTDNLGSILKSLASVLPVFKSMGYRRQVFVLHWGGFDTHSAQRGSGVGTQDSQFAVLAQALSAFDQSNQASGLNLDVTTFTMSDFGRTLRQASGGGSDHAWGSHWLAMGGAVAGGQVLGRLPSLVLGGVDDADRGSEGRFVPAVATDQFGATLMQWMGLPGSALLEAFPNLANFPQKNLGFMAS